VQQKMSFELLTLPSVQKQCLCHRVFSEGLDTLFPEAGQTRGPGRNGSLVFQINFVYQRGIPRPSERLHSVQVGVYGYVIIYKKAGYGVLEDGVCLAA
jgi:hypothetical protein